MAEGASSTESELDAMKRKLAEQDEKIKAMENQLAKQEMEKKLAEQDKKMKELEKKLAENNKPADTSTSTADGNETEQKAPSKSDVTLSLKGIPEYDSYPYSMSADRFFFMASIKAPYFRSEQRAPIDLIAVVDESGSMSGGRIRLVKETVNFIIKNLENGDRFGIVGFNSSSRIVLPLTKMDQAGRDTATTLTGNLTAGGGTSLCDGLVEAVNMMRGRKSKNEVASVMILTDGQTSAPNTAPAIMDAVKKGEVPHGSQDFFGGYHQLYQQAPPMLNSYIPPQQQFQQQQIPQLQQGFPMMQQQQNPQPQGFPMMQQQVQQPQQQTMNKKKVKKRAPQIQQQQIQQPVQILPYPPPAQPGQPGQNEEKEELKEKDDREIPCTINTFGFGTDHDENLLQAIAEHGRGMYAFIEGTDMIADTFAECLGGLVSIIGQNLNIKVSAQNNVEITKCLSKGYTTKEVEPKKVHEVFIKDLQSEENRDLMFELKMPKLPGAKQDDPIIQLAVTYQNVVKGKEETLSNVCCLHRIEGNQIGERNMELDLQHNRVMAANAMEEADKMANSGQLDAARNLLNSAAKHIQTSKSSTNDYSKNLVKDIQNIQQNMQSQQLYSAQGGKMMRMNMQSHQQQRAVQSSNYGSQMAYMNSSKKSMKKKFKK